MSTQIEKDAWKLSDTLAKTIEYLYKTDLHETARRKMVRDILKDNLISFHNELIRIETLRMHPQA
jgi:hypothetical protein